MTTDDAPTSPSRSTNRDTSAVGRSQPASSHWPVSPGWQWRVYFDRFRGHDDDGRPQADIRGGWAPTKRAATARIAEVIG